MDFAKLFQGLGQSLASTAANIGMIQKGSKTETKDSSSDENFYDYLDRANANMEASNQLVKTLPSREPVTVKDAMPYFDVPNVKRNFGGPINYNLFQLHNSPKWTDRELTQGYRTLK